MLLRRYYDLILSGISEALVIGPTSPAVVRRPATMRGGDGDPRFLREPRADDAATPVTLLPARARAPAAAGALLRPLDADATTALYAAPLPPPSGRWRCSTSGTAWSGATCRRCWRSWLARGTATPASSAGALTLQGALGDAPINGSRPRTPTRAPPAAEAAEQRRLRRGGADRDGRDPRRHPLSRQPRLSGALDPPRPGRQPRRPGVSLRDLAPPRRPRGLARAARPRPRPLLGGRDPAPGAGGRGGAADLRASPPARSSPASCARSPPAAGSTGWPGWRTSSPATRRASRTRSTSTTSAPTWWR